MYLHKMIESHHITGKLNLKNKNLSEQITKYLTNNKFQYIIK